RWRRADDWLGRIERWFALPPTYSAGATTAHRNVSRPETESRFGQTASTRPRSCRERSVAFGNRAGEPGQLRHRNHAAMGLGLDAGPMWSQAFAIHGRGHGCGSI